MVNSAAVRRENQSRAAKVTRLVDVQLFHTERHHVVLSPKRTPSRPTRPHADKKRPLNLERVTTRKQYPPSSILQQKNNNDRNTISPDGKLASDPTKVRINPAAVELTRREPQTSSLNRSTNPHRPSPLAPMFSCVDMGAGRR